MDGPTTETRGPDDREEAVRRAVRELEGGSEQTVNYQAIAARAGVDVDFVRLCLYRPSAPLAAAEATIVSPPGYELLGEAGRGGMGVVYRARQAALGREVALKVLRSADEALVRRFREEARALARLRHPHIVAIHEVGETGGTLFFAMDWIEGESLSTLLARGPLDPRRTCEVLLQVADAIAHSHEQAIVHRDLKPANVLLDRQGRAFVADFGLARDLSAEAGMTATGQVLGTPAYMSPEQARGETAAIGPATDVYGLGAILYQCLTGAPPFDRPTLPELIRAVAEEEPTPPRTLRPELPRDLEAICLVALAKDPSERYASARAMEGDLRRFVEGKPVSARVAGPMARAARRSGPYVAAVAAATALAWTAWYLVLPLATPRSTASLLSTAEDLHASGRHAAAVEVIEQALDTVQSPRGMRDADLALYRCGLEAAREHRAKGNWTEMRDLLQRVWTRLQGRTSPPDAELLWELAVARANTGDFEGAREGYRNIIDPASHALLEDELNQLVPALADPRHAEHRLAWLELSEALSRRPPARDWIARRETEAVRWLHASARQVHEVPALQPALGDSLKWLVAVSPTPTLQSDLAATIQDPSAPGWWRSAVVWALVSAADLPHRVFLPEPGRGHEPQPEAEEGALALWQETRALPRAERYKRAIKAAIDYGASHWGTLRDIPGWAGNWESDYGGRMPAGRDPLDRAQRWWEQVKDQDPRAWLAGALGRPVPGPGDLRELLSDYLRATPATRGQLRNLLALSLPEEVRPPNPAALDVETRWCRTVEGASEAGPYLIRVAEFERMEGEARTRLVWEEVRRLMIGEEVQVELLKRRANPNGYARDERFPGLGCVPRHDFAMDDPFRLLGRLEWREGRPVVAGVRCSSSRSTTLTREDALFDQELLEIGSTVRVVDKKLIWGDDCIILASVLPPGGEVTPLRPEAAPPTGKKARSSSSSSMYGSRERLVEQVRAAIGALVVAVVAAVWVSWPGARGRWRRFGTVLFLAFGMLIAATPLDTAAWGTVTPSCGGLALATLAAALLGREGKGRGRFVTAALLAVAAVLDLVARATHAETETWLWRGSVLSTALALAALPLLVRALRPVTSRRRRWSVRFLQSALILNYLVISVVWQLRPELAGMLNRPGPLVTYLWLPAAAVLWPALELCRLSLAHGRRAVA